jgi:hypothetical protein
LSVQKTYGWRLLTIQEGWIVLNIKINFVLNLKTIKLFKKLLYILVFSNLSLW